MARRSRVIVRGRGSDRGSVWIGVILGPTTVAAATNSLVGVLNAAALALRPFTVMRTRLDVMWASDQVAAIEDPFGFLGCIVVSDQATAAGVASVPAPGTNTDAPFFVHQGMSTLFNFITGVGFEGNSAMHYEINSKAMRKVGNNEDIAFVVSNSNSADGADVHILGRILVKLH